MASQGICAAVGAGAGFESLLSVERKRGGNGPDAFATVAGYCRAFHNAPFHIVSVPRHKAQTRRSRKLARPCHVGVRSIATSIGNAMGKLDWKKKGQFL